MTGAGAGAKLLCPLSQTMGKSNSRRVTTTKWHVCNKFYVRDNLGMRCVAGIALCCSCTLLPHIASLRLHCCALRMHREYRVWDAAEEAALRSGVRKHGLGAWERIRTDAEFAVLTYDALRSAAVRAAVPAPTLPYSCQHPARGLTAFTALFHTAQPSHRRPAQRQVAKPCQGKQSDTATGLLLPLL